MYKTNIKCLCIRNYVYRDLKIGMIFDATVELDKTGDTTFTVSKPDGGEIKCVREWFENYFEVVE